MFSKFRTPSFLAFILVSLTGCGSEPASNETSITPIPVELSEMSGKWVFAQAPSTFDAYYPSHSGSEIKVSLEPSLRFDLDTFTRQEICTFTSGSESLRLKSEVVARLEPLAGGFFVKATADNPQYGMINGQPVACVAQAIQSGVYYLSKVNNTIYIQEPNLPHPVTLRKAEN